MKGEALFGFVWKNINLVSFGKLLFIEPIGQLRANDSKSVGRKDKG